MMKYLFNLFLLHANYIKNTKINISRLSKLGLRFCFLPILLPILLLSGCKTITQQKNPESIGMLYGFQKKLVKGGDFWITTYQKIIDINKPYVFYIEGDGKAFAGRYRISSNPTPRKHMLIELATLDSRPNIVYVARPCQYTPMDLNPKCNNSYWTSKRLSEEVIESLNQVINEINRDRKFHLIGFSGGGGVAVLIAARNSMVRDIITISGNLDHRAFTEYHNVTPMIGSLNPIEYVEYVDHIPQLHLSGGRDRTVPPFIADKFTQASNSRCVKNHIFEDASHNGKWNDIWQYILTLPIKCYD